MERFIAQKISHTCTCQNHRDTSISVDLHVQGTLRSSYSAKSYVVVHIVEYHAHSNHMQYDKHRKQLQKLIMEGIKVYQQNGILLNSGTENEIGKPNDADLNDVVKKVVA